MNKYAVVGIVILIVIIAAGFVAMQPQQGQAETAPNVTAGDFDTTSTSLDQDLTTIADDTQTDPQQEILDV